MNIKILLAGDGGQGIQTMAEILAEAAFRSGKQITLIPNYGLEQRGGASLAFLQIADESVSYPRFSKPDIFLLMSEQVKERTKEFKIEDLRFKIIIDDYKKFLEENKILVQSYNIFFLGLITKILEEKKLIKKGVVSDLLEEKLGKKSNWKENKNAFNLGNK